MMSREKLSGGNDQQVQPVAVVTGVLLTCGQRGLLSARARGVRNRGEDCACAWQVSHIPTAGHAI